MGKAAVQMELSFEGGLLDQYVTLKEVVCAAIYGSPRQFKAIASDLDLSPSRLSRMLSGNPDDPLGFDVNLLPLVIQATGDRRPIYWLIEKFLEEPDRKRNRALDELAGMLPTLNRLLAQAQP